MNRKNYDSNVSLGKKCVFSLCCVVFACNSFAQVTVGVDEVAEQAALFQIKNVKVGTPASVTDQANATVDKDGGGLALPRVHLKNKATLEPFVATGDTDWIEASVNKIKEKHAGLMVYNLTTTGDFKQGVYVWDGAQWNIASDGGSTPTIDAWLQSGNAGTSRTSNFVGTTDAQGLGLRTNNTERLYISETGNIGIGVAAPTNKLDVSGTTKLNGNVFLPVTASAPATGTSILVKDNTTGQVYSKTNDAWSLSGNAGTTTGTHFVGTTDAQGLAIKTNNAERMRITDTGSVGIGTTAPSASLHVNGDMKLATAPAYSGADVMVRKSDGSVGIAAPEAPINKVMYAQATASQNFSGGDLTNLNAGTAVVVTWAAGDISSYGGLMTRNADNSFTFNEKALCEVSGYVNYSPNATLPDAYTNNWNASVAALNVTIQYALSTSSTTWVDLTGARHVFSGGSMGAYQSVTVPAAIMTFDKGDKIRMVVKRPNASFGLPHGTSASSSSIGAPTGSKFSKGFKVTTM